MKIAVLTKAIPSYESSIRIDSSAKWIDESIVNFVVNESDSYALEEALQIKEQLNDDSEVVVVIMGSESNTSKVLKDGLAKGADRGIFVNTPANIEPLAVSKILQKIVEKEKPRDGFNGLLYHFLLVFLFNLALMSLDIRL